MDSNAKKKSSKESEIKEGYMPIIAKSTGSAEFELCPEGTIQAVVSNVYDIGNQRKKSFDGKDEIQHQVIIMFELNERMKSGTYHGERFVISKTYRLSFHEKSNLHKDTEAIIGAKISDLEYDVESLIGLNCYLSIIHQEKSEKTYVNIQGIIALPNGVEKMNPELDRNHCPEWVKKKIDSQIKESVSMDEYFHDRAIKEAVEKLNSMIEDGIITSYDITSRLSLDYGVDKINELSRDNLSKFMSEIA